MDAIEIICTVVSTALAVIAAVLGGVKFLLDREQEHGKNKQRLDYIEKIAGNLPCESHLRRIERHDVQIAKEEEDIKNTNDRIDGILLGMSMGATDSSKKNSPYTLTEFGEYVLSESHGKECVDRNKDYLFGRIEAGLHSTPFDIERGSLRAVWDLFLTDKADDVKDYIYNAPDTITLNGKEYRLNQNDVQVAMALYLRDLYLHKQ